MAPWPGSEESSGRALGRWGPVAVAVVAASCLLPSWGGAPLVSHDHCVHLYRAWHFWEHMLLEGRLRGWSHFWFAGYPSGELYPLGTDLWYAATRVLTLGRLSVEATYALGFVLFFAFSAWALCRAGVRLVGAGAAVGGATLWALDPGAACQGGMAYTVDSGVWGQILAQAFLLLAWAAWDRMRGSPDARGVGRAGVLLALALLVHPMTLPLGLLSLAAWELSVGLAGERWGRGVGGRLASLLLGACLAGFWLVPMLGRAEWTFQNGNHWHPLGELARRLLRGDLLGLGRGIMLLAAVGAAGAVYRRDRRGLFLVVFGLGAALLGSSTVSEPLGRLWSNLDRIQFLRFTIPLKVPLFLLAGAGARELIRGAATLAPAWRRPARGGAALLVVALVGPWTRDAVAEAVRHVEGSLLVSSRAWWWEDLKDFGAWSRERAARLPGQVRVGHLLVPGAHRYMAAPLYNDLPVYKVGYTPARAFRRDPERYHPELFRLLSVRWVMAEDVLVRPELAFVRRFGEIHVYRFRPWQPWPFTWTGSGEARLVALEAERVAVRIEGATESGTLLFHVSDHPRWRVFQDGAPIPHEVAHPLGDDTLIEPDDVAFPQVRTSDGLVELRYVRTPLDDAGAAATLAGLLALGAAGVRARRRRDPPADQRGSGSDSEVAWAGGTGSPSRSQSRSSRPRDHGLE